MKTDSPSDIPFVYRRRVLWGDGDPAQIVYTVRFVDYAMEAVEGWFREVTGVDWYRLHAELGMGSPVVHLELDFAGPLVPGDLLELTVLLEGIGRSSYELRVDGRKQGSREVYTGRIVCAMVDGPTIRAIPVPADLRERMQRYLDACTAAGSTPETGAREG